MLCRKEQNEKILVGRSKFMTEMSVACHRSARRFFYLKFLNLQLLTLPKPTNTVLKRKKWMWLSDLQLQHLKRTIW